MCARACIARRCYAGQTARLTGLTAENLRRLMLASAVESSPGDKPGSKVYTISAGFRMESHDAGVMALFAELETKLAAADEPSRA